MTDYRWNETRQRYENPENPADFVMTREQVKATGGTILGRIQADLKAAKAKATEVRTTSSTGGEKGVKPEAWALLPSEALEEIARVYDFGARKYAANNWRKRYEWSKSFSALCRHIFAFWRGEDRDPESNLSHLAHAGFHILTMLTFWLDKEGHEFDDRYKPEEPKPTPAKVTGTFQEGSFT